jgi:hypothetical protein
VAVEDGNAVFCQCTFYVEGRDQAMQQLHERFSIAGNFGLSASTDWNSRVMWPIRLAGSDYFTFSEVRPTRISSKLRKAVFGKQLKYTLSSHAIEDERVLPLFLILTHFTTHSDR